jgi:hypothetical protein
MRMSLKRIANQFAKAYCAGIGAPQEGVTTRQAGGPYSSTQYLR